MHVGPESIQSGLLLRAVGGPRHLKVAVHQCKAQARDGFQDLIYGVDPDLAALARGVVQDELANGGVHSELAARAAGVVVQVFLEAVDNMAMRGVLCAV